VEAITAIIVFVCVWLVTESNREREKERERMWVCSRQTDYLFHGSFTSPQICALFVLIRYEYNKHANLSAFTDLRDPRTKAM